MPVSGPSTTPQYRQYTRQHYLAGSEREGGLVHLWHMEQLARLRLNDEDHLVNLREQEAQEVSRRAWDEDRRQREIRAREKSLYEANQRLLHHLVAATDDGSRRSRNMRLCPPQGEPDGEVARMQAKADEQLRYRRRAKEARERDVVRQNQRLLRHLIEVKPRTKTAKELDEWYNTVHQKRLRQLSRFKKAEPFAGARILEECGVRFGSRGTGHAQGDGDGDGAPFSSTLEQERYTRRPLVAGQPYPAPSLGKMLATTHLPRSLLPALQSTSYGGYALHRCDDGAEGMQRSLGLGGTPPLPPSSRRQRRPEWQSIAATDIPLMHYAIDKTLAEPGDVVVPEEEGPCTNLWRRRVRHQRERAEETRLRERAACSSMARASLSARELAILSSSSHPTPRPAQPNTEVVGEPARKDAPPPLASLCRDSGGAIASEKRPSSSPFPSTQPKPPYGQQRAAPSREAAQATFEAAVAASVRGQWGAAATTDGPFVAL